MERNELIQYWLQSATKDLQTMQKLFSMEEYSWSLFLGQLVLEKTLKALFTQNVGTEVPRIHDLGRLAKLSQIEVSPEDLDYFDTISTFNLNTRYPDIKLSFYR